VHFQLAMLTYNAELLVAVIPARGRQQGRTTAAYDYGDCALAFLVLVAKIRLYAGRVGISYSDQYAERGYSSGSSIGGAASLRAEAISPLLATALVF
jgi:hypothetical protein